jgi:aryl-alcohol dehydrogenase-like predicted oxidoreductase
MGTYLGDWEQGRERSYVTALRRGLSLGVNLLDTAANYQGGRTERALGRALQRAVRSGAVRRDGVIVCTKGGYAVSDDDRVGIDPEEIVDGNCMHPEFLARSLLRSRQRLQLATIDVYYLHNPEIQLEGVGSKAAFARRICRAFECLERARSDGSIGAYGIASWYGFTSPRVMQLEEVVRWAEAVGGMRHGFRWLQVPLNFVWRHALTRRSQRAGGRLCSTIAAARELGLHVVGSGALAQGRIIRGEFPEVVRLVDGRGPPLTHPQRALQLARSCGAHAVLFGTASARHVAENLALASRPLTRSTTIAKILPLERAARRA